MSNTEKITVYDVINACTEEGQWVNGEFEAIVTNASVGQGKKPSTADLCDPDSQRVMIKASWFGGGNFLQFAGSRCLFGGQGMKAKIYQSKNDLQMSAKTLVNVLQAGVAPAAQAAAQTNTRSATATTRAATPAPVESKEDIAWNFHKWMLKTALLLQHCEQYVLDMEVRNKAPFLPDQRQAKLTSLFMTAKDKGLLDNVPALRELDEKGYPIRFVKPVKNPDPEAVKKAEEEAARAAAQKAADEARRRAQENTDEDVPF